MWKKMKKFCEKLKKKLWKKNEIFFWKKMKYFCEKKWNIFVKKNEIFCEEYFPLKIAIGIGIGNDA